MNISRLIRTAGLIAVLLGIGYLLSGGTVSEQTTPEATAAATPPVSSAGSLRFDGQQAFKYAADQVAFGIRPTGSEASIKTGDYILARLKEDGWTATAQPFTLNVNGQSVRGRNIIGTIGAGPVIIIGAHYDTRLWANRDPNPANRQKPILGANDGASGVAVMLELARVLGQHYTYSRELRLVFLDAEDNGGIPGWNDFSLGTSYYVDHLDTTPEYVIILDMIGDKDLNIYYEGASMQSAPDIMTNLWKVADQLGYGQDFIPKLKYTMTDDHTPFIAKGIRAIDVIDFDYPYWHTLNDTLDKISAESMGKVGLTVQTYLEQSGAVKLNTTDTAPSTAPASTASATSACGCGQ